jgi:hypothetical protein
MNLTPAKYLFFVLAACSLGSCATFTQQQETMAFYKVSFIGPRQNGRFLFGAYEIAREVYNEQQLMALEQYCLEQGMTLNQLKIEKIN